MHTSILFCPMQALVDSLSLWRQEQESLDSFSRSNIGGLAMMVGVVSYLTHLQPHTVHSIVQEHLQPRLEDKGFTTTITHLQRCLLPWKAVSVLVEAGTTGSPLEKLYRDMLSQPSWDSFSQPGVTLSSCVLVEIMTVLSTQTWNKWPLVYDPDHVIPNLIHRHWGENFVLLDCKDWSVACGCFCTNTAHVLSTTIMYMYVGTLKLTMTL